MIRIGGQRDILGESPLWDEQAQALFWVDIRRPALRRLDHASGKVETRPMPRLVGSLALAGSGRLLVALGEQVALYHWAQDRLETVASLPEPVPGHRFNDGRCDRQGRFWVGTMHNVTRAGGRPLPVGSRGNAHGRASGRLHSQQPGLEPGRAHHVSC